MSNYIFNQCSSLEKIFMNEKQIRDDYDNASILKGEEFSYQIAYKANKPTVDYITKTQVVVEVNSPLKDIIAIYLVGNVPSELPAYPDNCDDNYITTEPGLFPDVLYPLENAKIEVSNYMYHSIWISVKTDKNTSSGVFPIEVVFSENDGRIIEKKLFSLEVIDAVLPEQKLIFTQWFHADCISTYYGMETFSEQHWQMIEKFVKMATDNGMNMLLTPIFTPPLDTEIGGERPTVQLVDVIKENGKYSFNFDKLVRWINLGLKNGIKYFEISHLFTQWGALAAPKIMAVVDGKKERIFGWETKGSSKEYAEFLCCFIPELIKVIKEQGIQENTCFHISDEPKIKDIASYQSAKNVISYLIKEFKTIDALSDYEMYKQGLVETPIASIDAIEPFIENEVPEIWAYNCCAQCSDNLSNRFMAMPSYRNRIIGCQLYKYNIKGFLHWGYNFYYTQYSKKQINPFLVTDAGGAFPSGDAFSVYPDRNGPIASIRLKVFNEALQDIRAIELLEQYVSKEEVLARIDAPMAITFKEYPSNPQYILNLRNKINQMIKFYVSKDGN